MVFFSGYQGFLGASWMFPGLPGCFLGGFSLGGYSVLYRTVWGCWVSAGSAGSGNNNKKFVKMAGELTKCSDQ